MFVSTAYAQTAAPAAGGADMIVQFLPLILIFVVFYFLLIRPQQKKMKEHKGMLESIRRGDRVVTGGGIIGTITKVGPDDELQVEIAENVRVRVMRSTVNLVLSKSEPAKSADEKAEEKVVDRK
ncbi:preprotein translocase subunit YajC (plasmid) [Azospirillum baldaniorum]|uniref:Sec translocon accessory complex subunit YajC n=2 Tax=Azospirillum TaxID=191 RepID=A0A2K1G642_9PROT|nr:MULTISPECIES: preprotein translocase subunit YajC [Azospirillum]TWA83665.1 protein translocase subunit yajC [Azospirillum brasilense]AIB13589.1 preprotein translocase subunit YajC [Azospirillum argentinense]AWJ91476.1 preprotein translocase subunit YajC [Azospirillum baldaniorum]EZQ06106.1 preprotein translocase subunit YajC [Azospirillum argentinense]KAA1052923.1 Protein translocase subunit YajC [Azospirillum argentinense]